MKINSTRLKQLRTSKNWSQEQLSETCGLSVRTIQRLENGDNASIESVRALAEVYDIDPSDLIITNSHQTKIPLDTIKEALLNTTNFSDTMTRHDYGWFLLFVILVMAIATIVHEQAYQVLSLIFLLPIISASTRRLRDAGYSGWWQLLFLVPFGQVVVFYLLAQPQGTHLEATGLTAS